MILIVTRYSQGEEIFLFIDACSNFLQSKMEAGPSLFITVRHILPVFLHAVADLANKEKAARCPTSPLRRQTITRALLHALQERILAEAYKELTSTPKGSEASPPSPSTVLPANSSLACLVNASMGWTLATTSQGMCWTVVHDVQSLALTALCQYSLYHSIPRTIELVSDVISLVMSLLSLMVCAVLCCVVVYVIGSWCSWPGISLCLFVATKELLWLL